MAKTVTPNPKEGVQALLHPPLKRKGRNGLRSAIPDVHSRSVIHPLYQDRLLGMREHGQEAIIADSELAFIGGD